MFWSHSRIALALLALLPACSTGCPDGYECKPIPSPAPTLVNVPPHTTLVGRIEGCNVYYIGEGDDGTTAVICHDGSTRTSARHLTSVKPIRYRYVRANMVERR